MLTTVFISINKNSFLVDFRVNMSEIRLPLEPIGRRPRRAERHLFANQTHTRRITHNGNS